MTAIDHMMLGDKRLIPIIISKKQVIVYEIDGLVQDCSLALSHRNNDGKY